ncbi:MAG: MdtA/MuxA family multidrug efflux RND transporter periplasmic adaptor subunit [Bdellovibrionales bacterium]
MSSSTPGQRQIKFALKALVFAGLAAGALFWIWPSFFSDLSALRQAATPASATAAHSSATLKESKPKPIGGKDKDGKPGMGDKGPTVVGVGIASKQDIPIVRQALGTVTPVAQVTIRTQINGKLEKVLFEEGQAVKAGDALAEIDSRPYQHTLEQAQGRLLRDQALLKDAEVNLARYKKLSAQDSISKQQLGTQAALVQQYQGAVKSDQAEVDQAKLNIEYCYITSPITGRAGLRAVDAGNYVQTSDGSGITTVTQIQPITVLFTLPEDNVPELLKQTSAGQELPVTLYDRARATKLATGKLIAMGNQIDTATGTVKLRAQFDNADNALFPNQFVNVEILVSTLRDATVIPSAAAQRGSVGAFVYLVKDDNTVTARPVTLGPDSGANIAVTEGLAVGDKVVTDGLDRLREGAAIAVTGQAGKP